MLIRSLLDLSERDVQALLDAVDPDEEGSLSKDDLLQVMRTRWPTDPAVTEAQLLCVWSAWPGAAVQRPLSLPAAAGLHSGRLTRTATVPSTSSSCVLPC